MDSSTGTAKRYVVQVGADTVRTFIAELPELGTGCADSVCALVGVVPVNRDSEKMRGKRSIFGGRGSVRAALHNAAMATVFLTKKDNVFKQMYQKMTPVEKSSQRCPHCRRP